MGGGAEARAKIENIEIQPWREMVRESKMKSENFPQRPLVLKYHLKCI